MTTGPSGIRIPSTAEGRADAIEALSHTTYRMDPQKAHELVMAWVERVTTEYPDDEIAELELLALNTVQLILKGDHLAAERVLAMITGRILEMRDVFSADDSATPRDVERINRVFGTVANANGNLCRYVNQLDSAYRWFAEAATSRGTDPRGSLVTAQTLANMGMVKRDLGDATTARQHFHEALGIMQSTGLHQHFTEYPIVLTELARIEHAIDPTYDAVPELREALAIARRHIPDGQAVDHITSTLGGFLLSAGSPREADNHVCQNIAIDLSRPQPVQAYSEAKYLLAHVRWSLDEVRDCTEILNSAILDDIQFINLLQMGSEELRLGNALTARSVVDLAVSLAVAHPDDTALTTAAMRVVCTRKDLSTVVQQGLRRAHAVEDRGDVKTALADLDRLKRRLFAAMLGDVTIDPGEALDQVIQAESHVSILARLVADLSPKEPASDRELDEPPLVFSMSALSKAIPTDYALIEYIRYLPQQQYYWLQPELSPKYAAFVWRAGDDGPSIVGLGDAAAIDDEIDDLVRVQMELADTVNDDRVDESLAEHHDAVARSLRRRLFDPVASAVGAVSRLLICPDSRMFMVSFAAFPVLGGHLIDHYEISYLDGVRTLLWQRREGAPAGPPVVIADPDYDAGLDRPSDFGFDRLDGTRQEGIDIAHRLGVRPLLGSEATGSAVQQVKSPSIFHIATHGWYLADPEHSDKTTAAEWKSHPRLANLDVHSPRGWSVRSGLALAGFNKAWSGHSAGPDVGLLTAGEASLLNMTGTELCVLSACETGRGGLFDLQGLTGLRRAFEAAGVRATVTALWQVPDKASQLLMTHFYRRLLIGEPKLRALAFAQREVRRRYAHAFFWAGFVLFGDPHPLSPEVLAALRHRNGSALCDTEPITMAQYLVEGAIARYGSSDGAFQRLIELSTELPMAGLVAAGLAARRGDTEEMRRLLRRAADAGESSAMHLLADSYGEAAEARRLYQAAFDQGLTRSGIELARSTRSVGDPHEDPFALLREAIDQGPGFRATDAAVMLGSALVDDGRSDEGSRLLSVPAEDGDPTAMRVIAELALTRGDTDGHRNWIERAATAGDPIYATEAGYRANDSGDLELAARLWRVAALSGNGTAAHNLGVLLAVNDEPGAEVWYTIGAYSQIAGSANNLAMYASDRGERQHAIDWWRIAIGMGHEKARTRLGHALVESDVFNEAQRWLLPRAIDGDAEAMTHLGELYEKIHRESDALDWFSRAADAGDSGALSRLADIADERGDADGAFTLRCRMTTTDASAAYKVASAYAAAGLHDKAHSVLGDLAAIGHADAAMDLARSLARSGDMDAARRTLSAAAVTDATARRAFEVLGTERELLQRHASQGHGEAAKDLFLLATFRGEEAEARTWLHSAADAGVPDMRWLAAQWALAECRWKDAARWLLPFARQGSAEAAELLIGALRAQDDPTDAAHWAKVLPKLRRAESELATAWDHFQTGDSVAALRHWEAAAQLGNVFAIRNVARAYRSAGRNDEAAHWQRIGGLVDYRMANEASLHFFSEGNATEALVWLRRAEVLARGGDTESERGNHPRGEFATSPPGSSLSAKWSTLKRRLNKG